MNPHSLDGSQASDSASHASLRRQTARPACTHTSMVRVYGTLTCQMCNRRPPLGFIYLCHQDLAQAITTSNISSNKRRKLRKAHHEPRRCPPSSVKQLESLGFSRSVVNAAERGYYSSEQIEILKEQKRIVKKTIRRSVEERDAWKWANAVQNEDHNRNTVSAAMATTETRKSLGDKIGSEKDERRHAGRPQELKVSTKRAWQFGIASTPPSSLSKAFEPCDLRVCHTCRPFFRDRIFVPFEAALYSSASPADKWIPQLMPIASVEVMKSIGLDKRAEPNGALASHAVMTNEDNHTNEAKRIHNVHGLTHHKSAAGFRESLEKDFENMMANAKAGLASNGGEDIIEEDLTLNMHESQPETFDLILWRSLNDAILEQAAQTPLPGIDGSDGLEKVTGRLRGLAITWPDENPIPEEIGTEPEIVEGGLALTEEAFENHSPDIITSL